jgi:2-oxoglutarate ferredoxin oxidoreductase subunit alpha
MSAIDLSFRLGGEAGQGVESSGSGFASALARAGYQVCATPDYYSRIRGGHNYFTIRVSDEPIYTVKETIELLLALNAETVARHVDALAPGGLIIVDEETKFDPKLVEGKDVHVVSLPFNKIAVEQGDAVMANTAAIGAACSMVSLELGPVMSVIADNFGKKGEAIIEANRRVAQAAFDLAKERYGELRRWTLTPHSAPPHLLLGTNQAFSMGAVGAGCRFYSGYPMTPASSMMEYMAAHAADWGIVMKHAEDEIAAVNMCVGAAHAGARALTATSGGGFDLMTEGVSLAAMTETPLVVYLAQRPGPATGMATRTAQADLFLALYAAHGEFPRVVLAPHTPEEAFYCALRAFNLAEKYQCVVIVLSDHHNASSLYTVDKSAFDFARIPLDRGKFLSQDELEALPEYKRYALTPDGVSPRALPGISPKSVWVADSNEHTEEGNLTEEADIAAAMLEKRMQKLEGIASEMRGPQLYGPAEAEITFLTWGSTFGATHEAMTLLNQQGRRANMVVPVDLWPFPAEAMRKSLSEARRLVDVEGNGTAQLAALLYMNTGIRVDQKILRYDGRGFTSKYILDRLEA